MKLFPIITAAVVAVLLAFGSAYGNGFQVYEFNNYPAEQSGSTLTGTITVSDTAPDDGLLSVGEILAWEFTMTDAGGLNTTT